MIVEKKTKPQHPARPEVLLVRQNEAQGPRDMGSLGQQHLALHQRLAHQSELVLLEIAQPAVDELGRLGRGAAGEIVHFAEADLERSPRGIARDACPIDPTADDEQIEQRALRFIHGQGIARLTVRRSDRKRRHGLPAQDRDLRRRCLWRLDHRAPLGRLAGRATGPAAACPAQQSCVGAARAGGRGDPPLPQVLRLRIGLRCKMRPFGLSPARLTGRGAVPILPHRKNGLKWRKYKAF